MDREITLAQVLATACFAALMFFTGYEFHVYYSKSIGSPRGSAPATTGARQNLGAARPAISNSDSLYDESGPHGTADLTNTPAEPAKPKSLSKIVALMPGQSFNAPRAHFRKLEVRSDYPIDVASGPCHESNTVEFFCDSEPADFFVRDTRRTPVFAAPKANNVTVTVTEF